MINILAGPLKAAGPLLNRLKFTKSPLPLLTHVRALAFGDRVTLSVSSLDQWLETTIPLAEPLDHQECLLIPAAAFKAALKADKGSVVSFARKGRKSAGVVHLAVTTGGITVHTSNPTLETDEFPACPVLDGSPIEIPARTLEMMTLVSTCASTDQTRYVLNGVLFTPEDGGMVVGVDGRRLAAAPATVPAEEFILPTQAVHVLGAPEFSASPCQVTVSTRLIQPQSDDEGNGGAKDPETETHVRFESGNHVLVSRIIDGNYPSWKQVVPREMVASVMVRKERLDRVFRYLLRAASTSETVNAWTNLLGSGASRRLSPMS